MKVIDQNLVIQLPCNKCGKLHNKDGETYISLVGMLAIGYGGGVMGSSPDSWEQGVPRWVYCPSCFQETLKQSIDSATKREQEATKRKPLEESLLKKSQWSLEN